MLIQVLKAGKERNWSRFRSDVRWTGTSGLLLGRVNVDIFEGCLGGRIGLVGRVRCLDVSRSRGSMWSTGGSIGNGMFGVLLT